MSPDSVTQFTWTFGAVEFDESRWVLMVNGEAVALERKPLELLRWMLNRTDEVLSKQRLLDAIWSDRIVVEAALTNAVGKLRRALGDDGHRIELVPRMGYRFAGPVSRVLRKVSSPTTSLKAGEPVPRRENFRLEQCLGRNGDREAWSARHKATGERRVFKLCSSEASLSTLKRELTLARVLHKAHGQRTDFVPLLDWSFDEAPYFVEMPYAGTPLDAWMAAQPELPSPGTLTELLARVANALTLAHATDVLHLDLKPANILLAEGSGVPAPRLGDFGSGDVFRRETIAALAITPLGTTGEIRPAHAGTASYLAPELARGEEASPASDVYALGVIAYQLSTGDFRTGLHPGWERNVRSAQMRNEIARLSSVDPRNRPSASEAAASFRSIETRDRRRTRWQALSLVAILSLLLAGTFGMVLYVARSRADAAPSVNGVPATPNAGPTNEQPAAATPPGNRSS